MAKPGRFKSYAIGRWPAAGRYGGSGVTRRLARRAALEAYKRVLDDPLARPAAFEEWEGMRYLGTVEAGPALLGKVLR